MPVGSCIKHQVKGFWAIYRSFYIHLSILSQFEGNCIRPILTIAAGFIEIIFILAGRWNTRIAWIPAIQDDEIIVVTRRDGKTDGIDICIEWNLPLLFDPVGKINIRFYLRQNLPVPFLEMVSITHINRRRICFDDGHALGKYMPCQHYWKSK